MVDVSPSEGKGSPSYCGSESDSADLILPFYLLILGLGSEGLAEYPQDVDIVVLVDPQPRHVLL